MHNPDIYSEVIQKKSQVIHRQSLSVNFEQTEKKIEDKDPACLSPLLKAF